MSKMHGDSEQIRALADVISDVGAQAFDGRARINTKILEVSQHWNDKKAEEFLQAFAEPMSGLDSFLTDLENYIAWLRRIAEAIDRYEELE